MSGKYAVISPSLRTILLLMNMMVLVLPLLGIFFFRFYENELVRQTEQELIAQSSVLSMAYIQELSEELGDRAISYGIPVAVERTKDESLGQYDPILPKLDLLAGPIEPPRPDGIPALVDEASAEAKAGRKLAPVLDEAKRVNLSGIRILDYKGRVVSPKEFGISYAGIPEIKRALGGEYTSVLRDRISDHPSPALASISRGAYVRVFVSYPVIHNQRLWGVVSISRTPKNILQNMYEEHNKFIVAAGTLVLMTLLISAITSRLVLRPLYKLMGYVKEMEARHTYEGGKPELFSVREYDELRGFFERSAKSLHDQSVYLENFAMHVSHEFKTPLTSMRGAAEILEDHKDLSDVERSRFIALIMGDIDRLRNLVRRLLELARADHSDTESGETKVEALSAMLTERYAAQGLRVSWIGAGDAGIPMDKDASVTVFVNLLDNALAHKADSVEISCDVEQGNMVCRIQDNGTGISPANFDKIFTPFFTTRRAEGGTGLGLDIVRSTLRAFGGTIKAIGPHQDQGACFVMTFAKK